VERNACYQRISGPSSATQIVLPSNFKEPQGGNTPILVSSVDCAESEPWMLISKQEMGKLKRIGTGRLIESVHRLRKRGSPDPCFPGSGAGRYDSRV